MVPAGTRRAATARPAELLTARYWADLVGEAETGLVDFVTVEDSLSLPPPGRPGANGRADRVAGRLDAVLVTASVAPRSKHVGLVPIVVVTHTEPFHISKAIATLDYASAGRAGVQVAVSARPDEARLFGRRGPLLRSTPLPLDGLAYDAEEAPVLFDEASDFVEVVRRLWDSWEDDAEVRDTPSGRFIDRAKLHYIEFSGRWFSVKGPSITPRPPQGQPVVSALAHGPAGYQLIARSADVGFVVPQGPDHGRSIVEAIRGEQESTRRASRPLHVLADLLVFLDVGPVAARDRKARLDALAGNEYKGDAAVFCGSPAQLADVLQEWHEAGFSGFRLRPATVPHDLEAITRGLVPELQTRGVFRRSYEAGTLRELLGLPRPINRYTAA
jgi:alkanesulfonate monooxygenase SsuD/methylene tetrahydromethanopterin reductase-like flavin-dependent oxidoreductase (luciferase family)